MSTGYKYMHGNSSVLCSVPCARPIFIFFPSAGGELCDEARDENPTKKPELNETKAEAGSAVSPS